MKLTDIGGCQKVNEGTPERVETVAGWYSQIVQQFSEWPRQPWATLVADLVFASTKKIAILNGMFVAVPKDWHHRWVDG